jgi:hypothetical protein
MDARESGEIQPAHVWKPDVDDHPVELLPIGLELFQGRQGGIGLEAGITGLPESLARQLTDYRFVIDDENRGHRADQLGLLSLSEALEAES